MDKARDIFARIWGKALPTDQKQWKVIAMCILGATTFWFFTALNKNYTTTINYPLSIDYVGKDSLIAVAEIPSQVRLNVSGGGWNLFRNSIGFGVEPLEYELNNPAETRFLLGSSMVSAINDQVKTLRLNRVITDTLHFHIEHKTAKTLILALDPNTVTTASDHTIVGDININPDTVQVEGPATIISALKDTIYLELEQIQINENYQDRVSLPGTETHLTWSTDFAEISFQVDPLVAVDREVNVRPVNFPEGYFLDPDQQQIRTRYQVPSSLKDSLLAVAIELWADFNQLQPDSTITPRVKADHPYILNITLDPGQVEVSYAK